MAAKNICHSLAKGPYMHHIKKTFILLLTLAFLLSAVVYVSDFSFETTTFTQTWLTKVMNWTHYKVINSTLVGHTEKDLLFSLLPNQQIQRRATIAQTTDIPIYHHVAHPSNYHFILDEPDKCSQWDPFLVFMVPVAPHQVEARNAIRSTWGNESSVQGKAVLTLFLVGLTGGPEAQQKLEEESRQHRDLVQSNFVDSYFNLTIKTMVIMDWLATRCPQASYAMKIDSDMYIGLENLMSLLLAPNTPRENYITGYLMWDRPVVRNKNSKWYVAEELYPEPKYPTYLLGMGYVFSNDLSGKIVEASKKVKAFNIEDAYVGTCLKQLGIAPSSPPDPSQFRAYLGQYKREDFLRVITTILGSPQQLIDIWKDLKKPT
ncbi:beta-1,3-galactosyltransferase 2-like isoform X3 [Carassius gibelio]|uniref:beta-1,3-galactosyltransferase 2-like isoform X3 n=1 Tax=Carassius gibelio TaxID=101364 RepID=UPI0022793390|nr:beta-1,3-galactosyltransferase 2-like isoform X3 [Carassius gibelio]